MPNASDGPSDEDLVAAFRAGDASAFDELVRRHRRAIHRACRSILRSPEQADEACQDAFVKAWHGLPSFQGGSTFKTWMYRIGMNAAYDMRSREATQARVAEDAAREAPPRPARPRALDDLIATEELGSLRDAVARLPDRQRETLMLKVGRDLKYTEIAEILGCPVGTAKANFHHAVQGLKRMLGVAAPAPVAPDARRAPGAASPAPDLALPPGGAPAGETP